MDTRNSVSTPFSYLQHSPAVLESSTPRRASTNNVQPVVLVGLALSLEPLETTSATARRCATKEEDDADINTGEMWSRDGRDRRWEKMMRMMDD